MPGEIDGDSAMTGCLDGRVEDKQSPRSRDMSQGMPVASIGRSTGN